MVTTKHAQWDQTAYGVGNTRDCSCWNLMQKNKLLKEHSRSSSIYRGKEMIKDSGRTYSVWHVIGVKWFVYSRQATNNEVDLHWTAQPVHMFVKGDKTSPISPAWIWSNCCLLSGSSLNSFPLYFQAFSHYLYRLGLLCASPDLWSWASKLIKIHFAFHCFKLTNNLSAY